MRHSLIVLSLCLASACAPSSVSSDANAPLAVAPVAPADEPPAPLVGLRLRELDVPEEEPPAPRRLDMPPRAPGAPRGTEFLARTAGLSIAERERAIEQELLAGNMPAFLRTLVPVRLAARTERGVVARGWAFVTPDYLAVGDDADFVRMPMAPAAAQRVADALGGFLPTKALVDAVYRDAEIRLDPQPLTPGPAMRSNAYFRAHNDVIEAQLSPAPREVIVAGHKKDVVVTGRLVKKPGRVAIYGWHMSEEEPIQPLSTWHRDNYSDYSHGVRLVHPTVLVGGVEWTWEEVLTHPSLSLLASEEGPLPIVRASTTEPAWDADELRTPSAAVSN